MNDYIIIDGHAHMYSDEKASKIIDSFTAFHQMHPTSSLGKGTFSDIQKNMKNNNIKYTVIANFAPAKTVIKNNEWTLSMAKKHKALIPLVSVYPGMPVNLIHEFFLSGAKGIKMHNGIQKFAPTDPGLKHIYKYCSRYHIPITFHCGETSKVHMNNFTNIDEILPVLEEYPEIPLLLTHMAAGKPEDVYKIASLYKNVYFDTSITITGECCIDRIHDSFWEDNKNVETVFKTIGCQRIMFGSDYPFGNPASDIKRIISLDLTPAEKNMILGKNTLSLYNMNNSI